MNIYKLSKLILVYNVNSTSNENSQISKIVDVVLYYQLYSKQTLLTVSSLHKQYSILSFTWLKNYNLKMNWQKREVVIMWCSVCCTSCQNLNKTKKHWEHALNTYRSSLFPILVNNWKDTSLIPWTSTKYQKELSDCFYMT